MHVNPVIKPLFLSGLLTLLQGCSSQQIYHGFQQNRQQECQALHGDARERCLEGLQESWRDYEQRRQEQLSD